MREKRLIISLVIPYYQKMFSSFYTLEIIKEVSRAAIKLNVDLLIETKGKMFGVSGILFADIMGNELLIKKARQKKIPYIILNYYDKDSRDNCIGIDNQRASLEAVDYLIKAGHRRIATITGKLDAQAGTQRREGFRQALKAKKIDLDNRYIASGDWTKESGREAMNKLISLGEPPTAVFAAGDEMAIGAMEVAKEEGLKIPDDISFVGFDNIPQTDAAGISLTTIEQPFAELSQLGIKYLMQIIGKKSKQPVKVLLTNAKLIKRKSVRKL
ncbi:MAG: substrate-binding domain-containing protein [Candidatus Omnitrophica bacterium]|nr:substrate-binding domain-containing protein [Candidatus Omnitrophota bacterium]MBU4346186.1 substrate-binding domain-containing protein [Candidatus Omnitrophota bacterium]